MFAYYKEKLQFDLFVSLKVNRHCHYTKKLILIYLNWNKPLTSIKLLAFLLVANLDLN